ncbi:Dam family site-specific DNA-(adenine-N6)-methyltransferase [Streptococcus parasanguinis]|uniref:DNA adenine methylase n=1 Tax=Streptococcus parasanguinis TaxID=1318 RepID=UPI0019118DCC|nr:Dam family site-specific DNA-(adenine-N6)-methyltransferase [Streptococcus parasanguinis]MBK5127721.1 Dam family site-specific DNA-(adenine-N6)-methyltransferase [Streptococcus parasanguinis]
MQPFVKWAGGKRQLLSEIKKRIPSNFNTYYEPFIGGGALLLELEHTPSIISDNNHVLIEAYKTIRDFPGDLKRQLDIIQAEHNSIEDKEKNKEFYYSRREEFNSIMYSDDDLIRKTTLFIYLNKACFNGLYRVNQKGFFNVPSNQKTRITLYNERNIDEISSFLKNVKIYNQDFEKTVETAKKGDLVFFDSPYAPLNPQSFDTYTKEGFSIDEHVRLANLYKSLSKKGVFCILTNHNTELIRELYQDFTIEEVNVKRLINSDSKNRVGKEIIVTNYDYEKY